MRKKVWSRAVKALFGIGKAKVGPAPVKAYAGPWPPRPVWRPSFAQPLEQIADRLSYYTNGTRDFAVLCNGTGVLLPSGLSDSDAKAFALKVLTDIIGFHPDMSPKPMDDGNIVVQYNHPALNVVLSGIAKTNWAEIETRHLDGLTPSEVLITPLGPNKFDDIGKQALLGRAYMFIDAIQPEIAGIYRASN